MALHFAVNFLVRVSLLLTVAAIAGCGTGPAGVADSNSGGGSASAEAAAAANPGTGKPETDASEAETPETGKPELAKPGKEIADPGTTDSGKAAAEPSSESADGTPRPVVKGGILSAAELAKILDLRQLPALEGAKFHTRNAAQIGVDVPGRIAAIFDFYLKTFAAIDFESTTKPGSPISSNAFAHAQLTRAGFVVFLTVTKGTEPGTMTVMLKRVGKFDCSALPVSKGAKVLSATTGHAEMIAQGSVAEESEWVIKALTEQGWQQFEVPFKPLPDSPDWRRFQLRNQGYVVSVSVNKAAGPNSSTFVMYATDTIAHELPAPPDARDIVFDDAKQTLKCQAPGDVVDAAEFYRDTLPKVGYKALQDNDPQPNHILLCFEPPEQGIMLVDLTTEDHMTTRVDLTWHPPESPAESDASEK